MQQSDSSGTTTSSFMSKFYMPMNIPPAPVIPSPPPAPPSSHSQISLQQQQQQQWNMPVSATVPTPAQSLGANAAFLLASLSNTPGFLSETAIQEARQEYTRNQQVYHQEHPNTKLEDMNRTTLLSTNVNSDGSVNNTTSSIEALLNELKQTAGGREGQSSSSASGPSPSTVSVAATPLDPPSFPPPISEDYSSGKITPQLLKRLAAIAEADAQEGGTLLSEIKRLRERQSKTERSLYDDRQAILEKHKKALIQLQASEIMGVNIAAPMQVTKNAHVEELKQFDKHVIRRMDKEIAVVQDSLSKAGVPMMSPTQDPVMITAQIRVLRLLEDMLQS